jgi:hypothetical protein
LDVQTALKHNPSISKALATTMCHFFSVIGNVACGKHCQRSVHQAVSPSLLCLGLLWFADVQPPAGLAANQWPPGCLGYAVNLMRPLISNSRKGLLYAQVRRSRAAWPSSWGDVCSRQPVSQHSFSLDKL